MLIGLVAAVPAFLAGRWSTRHVWRLIAFAIGWAAGVASGVAVAFAVTGLVDAGPVGPYAIGIIRASIGASVVGALFGVWRK
jgi:hypothetical protein